MNARQLKDKFINFFVDQNHQEIPSASLIPENDPTTLFISAGMHPLVPYLLGQTHPSGKRLVNVQKCVRTGDIDEVGDTFHHTFFEMLGNWSLGDYFKTEMIPWSLKLIQQLGYDINNLHITCFEGDSTAPKDDISANLWRSVGISEDRIHFLGKKDNWWGPAGLTGPCGPDSEMFIDTDPKAGPIDFKKGCKNGRIVEIGNDVFMEYDKQADGTYKKLSQINVDTGWGVERNLAILSGFSDDYLTSIWQPIIKQIELISGSTYNQNQKAFRIIADHIRAAVFIINDGVLPSNKEAGYVVRRLIRRSIVRARDLDVDSNFVAKIGQAVIDNQDNYAGNYDFDAKKILDLLTQEENKFRKTLNKGLAQIEKLIKTGQVITGQDAFDLYQSYGFPFELLQEQLKKHHLSVSRSQFEQAQKKHQQQSQQQSAGKFKSGLADNSDINIKYHTCTHLLHSALRQLLGSHVHQSGSNINSDRLRFDFTHPQALTDQQIKQVEDLVNQQIKANLIISKQSLPLKKALSSGAMALFKAKYPPTVNVYSIGDFSKEICAGPHLSSTGQIGKFKIIKQESSSAGIRRLYAQCS